MRKETKIILVRHGQTIAADIRKDIEKSPDWEKVRLGVNHASAGLPADVYARLQLVQEPLRNLQPLLQRYAQIPHDPDLPILPSEHGRLTQVGQQLDLRFDKIDRLQSSDYLRAYQTALALKRGSTLLKDLSIKSQKRYQERRIGREQDLIPFRETYFASHPEELVKSMREGDNYRSPGEKESLNGLKKRVKRNVRWLRLNPFIEGKSMVVVSHSDTLGEYISQFGGKERRLATGSVTVVTAKPRKWYQILKPREFTVGSTLALVD